MVLLKKLFCSEKENILKVLWGLFSIVVIIMTIVILSIYVQKASNLRTWRNDTDVYVKLSTFTNMTTFENFLKFLKMSSSNNDSQIDDTGITRSDVNTVSIESPKNLGDEDSELSSRLSEEGNEGENGKVYKRICKDLPPKDDFSKCGPRVADRKCCEYIWAWKYKDDLIERSNCLSYGVIGGSKAEAGEFPHMVAVGFEKLIIKANESSYSFFCGGSLISERFVLTAAHCTRLGYEFNTKYNRTPQVVGMGSENLTNTKSLEIVKIVNITLHPKYHSPKRYYDIALLQLFSKVDFTYTIHPACLSTELNPKYTKANITGWGTTNSLVENEMSDHLQVATVNLIKFSECKVLAKEKLTNRNFGGLQYHQLCAGNLTGPVDTCKGDSGGPLQVRIKTEYGKIHRVIGVTSFGKRCAVQLPGIYVRVSSVISWIEKIVWSD